MERNTKHRILGILVVIALVIISLPLLQPGKDTSPTQTAAMKAPPFPEQTVASNTVSVQPDAKPLSAANQATETPDDQPDDVISTLHPSVINAQTSVNSSATASIVVPVMTNTVTQIPPESQTKLVELPVKANNADTTTADKIVIGNDAATENLAAKTANAFAPTKSTKNSVKTLQASNSKAKRTTVHVAARDQRLPKVKPIVGVKTMLKENGLISLKNAAFVIQMGSFKNKTNALHLVNQLRANGYPAFIQKISTAFGENTRVFVGPANKRTTARALADRLETDMHLRGIVISYQPLTL